MFPPTDTFDIEVNALDAEERGKLPIVDGVDVWTCRLANDLQLQVALKRRRTRKPAIILGKSGPEVRIDRAFALLVRQASFNLLRECAQTKHLSPPAIRGHEDVAVR